MLETQERLPARSNFRPAIGRDQRLLQCVRRGPASRAKPGYNCRVDDCNFDAACRVYTQVATATSQGDPMRTFVLLFVLVMPALGACGAAWAKTSADIGKPVCTHYDDNAKVAARASTDSPVASTAAATTPAAQTSGNAATAQVKGGASGLMHPRNAPRWQTLLPGMFR
jgi:hypothetical protein